MTERCHDLEELGVLAGLAAGDPRLAHTDSCPNCRALLAAYRRFAAGCPAAGDADREHALGQFLAREIGGADQPATEPRPSGILRLVRARFLAPGLAVAAVLVLFLSFQQYRSAGIFAPSAITRGDEVPALQLEAAVAGTDGMRLSWQPLAGAQSYVVVLYAADLRELARFETAATPSLLLRPDQLAALDPAPQPLLWRVEARQDGDLLRKSAPGVLPAFGTP